MNHDKIENVHNTARYFVEQRHVAWVLLLGTFVWGVYGYWKMPQRKDPEVPVREAMAMIPWPGMPAEKIEQLVTKRAEAAVAKNSKVTEIRSISRTGVTVIYFKIDERVGDPAKEFDDIKMKLDAMQDLPDGAGPVEFVKDFGDTAALVLTVASPRVEDAEIDLRAREIEAALTAVRAGRTDRVSLVACFPASLEAAPRRRLAARVKKFLEDEGRAVDLTMVVGSGFVALDGRTSLTEDDLLAAIYRMANSREQRSELHPDAWEPVAVRDLSKLRERLRAVAGSKYSFRQLDQMTERIEKALKIIPEVSRVSRSGVVPEQVELLFSQERLASHGVSAGALKNAVNTRNIAMPGGVVNAGGRNLAVAPSGEFRSEREIGEILVPNAKGTPAHLRDLVDIQRTYQTPARFFNYYHWRDAGGQWMRSRAITLDVQMRSGQQIGVFGAAVDAKLAEVRQQLPPDLVMARTSDQPQQVAENVGLFMNSLWEAILLVVLVSLIGFWEWRSAVLMAVSIPITLAMTFGMMQILGVDLQQVSIASLIIALGLLVDDPVVAGDAIKRDLAAGHPPKIAAWLGPTKLAHAILYATITNIVAYLPFLLLSGDTGRFVFSLPIVIGSSLVASRLVSMTFIPLLGYYLLRGRAEPSIEERRTRGFAKLYYRFGGWAIENRWKVLAASTAVLAAGGFFGANLKKQLFPADLQYLAWVDVWLPEDASLASTQQSVRHAERLIQQAGGADLESLTSWIGGGGPRFWYSAAPEPPQLNYGQILIRVRDKHHTAKLLPELQRLLSSNVANARVDVRALETGPPVGVPVAVRLSGEDLATLREGAAQLHRIFREAPLSARIRDDWGEDTLGVDVRVDPDRASLAGVTSHDVALSSITAFNGTPVATLRDGDRSIPIVARVRLEERAEAGDLANLYVHSQASGHAVPLSQVAAIGYKMQPAKIRRLDQYRTITVSAFPAAGSLPSELLAQVMPRIREFEQSLPSGYRIEFAGEYKEQTKSFRSQATVMAISVTCIFLALVIQFRHAFKPLIVFAAIPYGIMGALASLWFAGAPFGFMAFLGIASLVGVIVSHVIVLFDFIEERHAEGAPLREALLDAGILRLRPVLITVGATVIALFPLAAHGGPLWESLCYAQIGGLTISTVITLVLVPVVYAIFVRDLKLVRWEESPEPVQPEPRAGYPAVPALDAIQ